MNNINERINALEKQVRELQALVKGWPLPEVQMSDTPLVMPVVVKRGPGRPRKQQ